jgi:hypothetical protein
MKRLLLFLAIAFASGRIQVRPSATVPFTIDASEDVAREFPGAPRLQSFSFAQWKGRWIFIGGRISGYHAGGGGSAEFLRADANRDVWVIDTTVKPAKTYHVPVALPMRLAAVQAQWASTGQLYFQDGDTLYIAGGYGQDERGKWSTMDVISQVSLPNLIDGVIGGSVPPESISFGRSPVVQSTGGGLSKLDDGNFYLVMGHSFQGSYTAFEGRSEQNSNVASQTYLNEIRKFSVKTRSDGGLDIIPKDRFHNDAEFHRRDLNVTPFTSPDGLGLAAYGGVFTPDLQLSYSRPIYIRPGAAPSVDFSFNQKMNAYTCAVLLMYSKMAQTMYSTFFGGISQSAWNPLAHAFEENPRIGTKTDSIYLDGLQWSDQVSTLQKHGADTTEFVHSRSLPAFLGTGAVFIAAPELTRARTGTDILAIDSFGKTKTFVGYIYGGIRAFPYRFPYLKTGQPHNSGAVPTKASDMILKVYVERS